MRHHQRIGGVALVLSVALAGGPILSGGAGAAGAPAPQPTQAASPGAVDEGVDITLLTGEVVRLHRPAGAPQHAELVSTADSGPAVSFTEMNGDLYAIPGAAMPLIVSGKLDQRLFDLTVLAADGYDDAHSQNLPVIASYQQAPPSLQAATVRRSLDSINAQALGVAKKDAVQFWHGFTGAQSASSGVNKLWLDDKVQASLDVSVPAIGAPSAWQAGLDGTGTKVAVLDTGIDLKHPDLAGKVVSQKSFVAGVDSVQDGHGHGTHVSSIATGTGAASGGKFKGVAPGAKLVVGKVLDDNGRGSFSDVIAGMEWAAASGAAVVNLSLGGGVTDGSDPTSQALNRLTESTGTLFVVAAGNKENVAQSVVSPGSADKALTVSNGAKATTFALNSTSSIGPRWGDWAIKPEIGGPGTDVTAARAAGTKMGGPSSDGNPNYTSATGTSMATPHVAGAAAILRQQHPDWKAQQIKDALVSSAVPGPWSATTQGGGMVNVARATTAKVLAPGTASFGLVPYPEVKDKVLSTTLPYTNQTDQPVRLDLGLRLGRFDQRAMKSVQDTPYTPRPGAVTISPSTLEVPAHGTVNVDVKIKVSDVDDGVYSGWLEGRVGSDQPIVRTTVGWVRDPQRFSLKLRAVDRASEPLTGWRYSHFYVYDLDLARAYWGYWENGVGVLAGLGPDPKLPAGRYAVMAEIYDWGPPPLSQQTGITLAQEPELVLDQDRTLQFDARKANRVQVDTPRPATRQPGQNQILVNRELPPDHYTNFTGPFREFIYNPGELYFLPSETSAQTGTYNLSFVRRLVAPPLSLTPDDDVAHLHPAYPLANRSWAHPKCGPQNPECFVPFPAEKSYRVADAGSGSPGELAKAGVVGKLALVHETTVREYGAIDQYATDAKAAGAAGVVLAIGDTGPLARFVNADAPPTIPIALVSTAEGNQLAAAVAKNSVTLQAGGQYPSPYTYNLGFTEQGRLPAGATYRVTDNDLATVHGSYHATQPGVVYEDGLAYSTNPFWLGGPSIHFSAPSERTDYVTAGHGWSHSVSPGYGRNGYREVTQASYSADEYAETHFGAVMAPVASAFASKGAGLWVGANVNGLAGPGQSQTVYAGMTNRTIRFYQGDSLLCEDEQCKVPGPGTYRMTYDGAQKALPWSDRTHTEWTVKVPPLNQGDLVTLPMVNLWYTVATDQLNTVREHDHEVTVRLGHVPSVSGGHSFTVRAAASYDDGATWHDLGSRVAEDGSATFPVNAPTGGVALRVEASDEAGNTVSQTVYHAYSVR